MIFYQKKYIRLKIVTSFISLIFFLFLFYFTSLMVEEAFVKNYTTGTVWESSFMDTLLFNVNWSFT